MQRTRRVNKGDHMKRELKKNEKIQIGLLSLSVAIIILGILFLVNAMQEDPANGFFPAFCEIDNLIGKYIIVILTMACGIMLFSNVAITIEDKKLRNGLTIGITAFSTVLTVPLVYVFIAIFPYAADPVPFEELNAVDAIMRTDRIHEGFVDWFSDGGLMWAVYAVMLVLSLVFITFPLLTGILAVKNEQTLGFRKEGFPFGVITLPVVAKQRAAAAACESGADASAEEAPAEGAALAAADEED